MPKVVDPQARRDALSRALWKVVQRDGIGAVSVRSVAAEANCSPSALRHYFPTPRTCSPRRCHSPGHSNGAESTRWWSARRPTNT